MWRPAPWCGSTGFQQLGCNARMAKSCVINESSRIRFLFLCVDLKNWLECYRTIIGIKWELNWAKVGTIEQGYVGCVYFTVCVIDVISSRVLLWNDRGLSFVVVCAMVLLCFLDSWQTFTDSFATWGTWLLLARFDPLIVQVTSTKVSTRPTTSATIKLTGLKER